MRKMLLIAAFVVGVVSLGSDPLNACGDKFLVIGGAALPRGYAAIHPASILVVRHGKSGALAIDDPQLVTSFERAGHRVRTIDNPVKLAQALRATRFDMVLVDFSEADAIESVVRDSAAKPALVPVMYKPKPGDVALAEKQYVCLLKAPEKATHFLQVIDDLMKTRLDAAKAAKTK